MVAKDFNEPVTFGGFNRRMLEIERRIRALEDDSHHDNNPREIERRVRALEMHVHHQGDQIVATQADIDALTAALTAEDAELLAAVVAIQAEIAALQEANPELDLSGLTGAVAATSAAVDAVAALVPPAVEPPPAE